ncbi:MAG: FHA domain-containing protein [Chloroflexota bacterium]
MPERSPTSSQPENICQNCGHRNRPGDLICSNCGQMLTGEKGGATRRLQTDEMEKVEVQSPSPTPSHSHLHFPANAAVAIQLKELQAPLVFEIEDELVIGRYDKTADISPDIDLHRFAGYLLGVSRRHAILHRKDERLMLEDLGSSNGTFLNGKRLSPRELTTIPDGSVVRLGDLSFRLRFHT